MTEAARRLAALKERFGAGRFVETNGARLHYARLGDSGPPLILIHGWPEFWLTWHRNLEALAEDFTVHAIDLRGFGESRTLDARNDPPLTPAVVSADIAGFMDELGIERAGFAAHDVGANAMQTFARTHSDRVAALFFFNCPHPGIGTRWAEPDTIPAIWYQTFHQLDVATQLVGYNRDTVRIYLAAMLNGWSHDPHCFDADLELWVETFSRPGALARSFSWYKAADAGRRRLMREGPPRDLSTVTAPTRVFWGAEDPIIKPDWADALADVYSDIRMDLAPEAGHFVHYEQAEAANREMRAFFGEKLSA